MLRAVAPQFFSTDIGTTVAYYESTLGFRCLGTWMEPPVYAILERDGLRVHVRCAAVPSSADKYEDELLDAYFTVDDVDALHDEFQARGVTLARALGDTPWGAREFVVRDADGRLLAFGAARR